MIDTPDDVFGEEFSDTFKIEDVFSLEATTIELQFVKQEPLSDEEESKPVWYIDSSVVKTETKSRKCKKCLTLFTNRWSFKEHVKFCNNRFQCSECQKRFWNSSLLKRHKQRALACVSERSLRYCQECEMLFRWKHQLLFHIIQHSPVSCEFCGSEFQSVERLRRHFLETH